MAGADGADRESRRRVFGWAMYDFAVAAYSTTAAVAVLPAYFAGAVVPAGGISLFGAMVSATTLWGLAVGTADVLVFAASPWLGAVADRSAAKKRFLVFFCCLGCLATILLGTTRPGDVWPFLALFMAAQFSYAAGNVCYDAFLPQLVPPKRLNVISARGYAYGYIGGGLEFAACLAVIALHDRLGLTQGEAARLALAATGLWWGGFALVFFVLVPETGRAAAGRAGPLALAGQGLRDAWAVLRKVLRHREQRRFLAAYFFFIDGIQTVIFMATIYGKEELKLSDEVLMLTLLAIQFVAYGGAVLFGRLGQAYGARRALLISLMVWLGIVVYASVMTGAVQYFALGLLVGTVLGGSQSQARALFASMIPVEESASYFGFFSVMNKLSAVLGPFVFAGVRQFAGSSRPAILALAVFFGLGLVLLLRVRAGGPSGR